MYVIVYIVSQLLMTTRIKKKNENQDELKITKTDKNEPVKLFFNFFPVDFNVTKFINVLQ